MPESIKMTLDAFINLTGDPMLIVDPKSRTIRYASPRAIDLTGPVLRERDTPASEVFLNEGDCFDRFVADALTVTDPIVSSVSVLPDLRKFSVKGRRISLQNGAPQVLLLLEAEPEISHRFRLLSEKMDELREEVRRRVAAEQRLSDNIQSLQRAVLVIKQLSELDISSGDYLELAVAAVASAVDARAAVAVTADLGKLRVTAQTGEFTGLFDKGAPLDLSLAKLESIATRDGDEWRALLLASLTRACGEPIERGEVLVRPLFVSGERRGALICVLEQGAARNSNARLELDIFGDALSGLLSRAEIEARLVHAQKLHAIGQLTGGIAHDFNNILAVVLGNSELLLEEMGSLDMELAREIREAAVRGATLTSRLLAFARKQPLDPKLTDANRLLRELDPLIRRTIRENIDYELISAGGLWKAHVDQSQLENAVLNLAVNARDAMPDGGRLTIETANIRLDQDYADRHSEVRAGQYVMIAVSDTGHGMDPEVMKEAFTPFFTTKGVGKGSGLGLSMVFGFVKQSLGHVKIYSEVGLGTTVRMYFPRDLTDLSEADRERIAGSKGVPNGKGRLLLVEDDHSVLKYLKRSLEAMGYDVDSATTGEEAADLLRYHEYDLLLTDVVLPGPLNGAQLASIAREIAPEMPVLFMSGYTENSIVHHGRLDPGVDFISKPFTRDQLAKRLRAMLKI